MKNQAPGSLLFVAVVTLSSWAGQDVEAGEPSVYRLIGQGWAS